MFNIITGIELGKHGVLLKTKTTETFIESENFDVFKISRVGCRVNFTGVKTGNRTYWHCADLRDAKDFMTWMAGTKEDKCI